MQPGYNGQGKIDSFLSTVREHTHSLIYEPNDGRDCHTSAPYRSMRSGTKSPEADAPNTSLALRLTASSRGNMLQSIFVTFCVAH